MFTIEEKTQEEKTKDAVRGMNSHAVASVENAKNNYRTAFNLLWDNENATPQEICDALGNQAYKLFENAMIWISAITKLDPTWVYPPAPNEFTINPDGTVTIGEPINPEE